jgi:acyl-CoA synthetase (AMP-forming)/AMP-acid ligase II
MKGYWNRPEETAAVLQDGWLRTGDLAVVDKAAISTLRPQEGSDNSAKAKISALI